MFNIIDFNDRHHETDQTYSEVSRLCVCCTALCICQWMLRQEFCRIWYTSVIFIWFHETIALPQDYFRPCQMSSEYSFRVFPIKESTLLQTYVKSLNSFWQFTSLVNSLVLTAAEFDALQPHTGHGGVPWRDGRVAGTAEEHLEKVCGFAARSADHSVKFRNSRAVIIDLRSGR